MSKRQTPRNFYVDCKLLFQPLWHSYHWQLTAQWSIYLHVPHLRLLNFPKEAQITSLQMHTVDSLLFIIPMTWWLLSSTKSKNFKALHNVLKQPEVIALNLHLNSPSMVSGTFLSKCLNYILHVMVLKILLYYVQYIPMCSLFLKARLNFLCLGLTDFKLPVRGLTSAWFQMDHCSKPSFSLFCFRPVQISRKWKLITLSNRGSGTRETNLIKTHSNHPKWLLCFCFETNCGKPIHCTYTTQCIE